MAQPEKGLTSRCSKKKRCRGDKLKVAEKLGCQATGNTDGHVIPTDWSQIDWRKAERRVWLWGHLLTQHSDKAPLRIKFNPKIRLGFRGEKYLDRLTKPLLEQKARADDGTTDGQESFMYVCLPFISNS